jgi:hypothetical protein
VGDLVAGTDRQTGIVRDLSDHTPNSKKCGKPHAPVPGDTVDSVVAHSHQVPDGANPRAVIVKEDNPIAFFNSDCEFREFEPHSSASKTSENSLPLVGSVYMTC